MAETLRRVSAEERQEEIVRATSWRVFIALVQELVMWVAPLGEGNPCLTSDRTYTRFFYVGWVQKLAPSRRGNYEHKI